MPVAWWKCLDNFKKDLFSRRIWYINNTEDLFSISFFLEISQRSWFWEIRRWQPYPRSLEPPDSNALKLGFFLVILNKDNMAQGIRFKFFTWYVNKICIIFVLKNIFSFGCNQKTPLHTKIKQHNFKITLM